MGCYYTLCHNTYAYSLLFYKVYMKRENAGSWDYGLEKEQILETYSAQLQRSWNFTEVLFGINKKYWAEKIPEGGHTLATRVGARPTPWARPLPRGPPGRPLVPIFCYMKSFTLEKITSKLSWRSTTTMRRNQSRALAELFCRGNIPPGEGNRHHRHHHRSSHWEGVNLHQHLHQHHLISNPSSSLVSNPCIQTSNWYLWVASSVDYSL